MKGCVQCTHADCNVLLHGSSAMHVHRQYQENCTGASVHCRTGREPRCQLDPMDRQKHSSFEACAKTMHKTNKGVTLEVSKDECCTSGQHVIHRTPPASFPFRGARVKGDLDTRHFLAARAGCINALAFTLTLSEYMPGNVPCLWGSHWICSWGPLLHVHQCCAVFSLAVCSLMTCIVEKKWVYTGRCLDSEFVLAQLGKQWKMAAEGLDCIWLGL